MSTSPGARLRALMDNPPGAEKTVMMPGAFNALCAKMIADAGFGAAYISGAATSVAAGVPDVGLLTLEHFCRCIREAHDASGLPIIADADTGFGESEMVRRTVIEYARAGAAGLHIEDQVFPKRCGHLDGKKLVPLEHAVEKVRAAVGAARDLNTGAGASPGSSGAGNSRAAVHGLAPGPLSDFIICARTDARGVEGFDAAVARAKAYVEAGADMIFPEGLATEQEFADFASKLRASMPQASSPTVREGVRSTPGAPTPSLTVGLPVRPFYLLANMTEFGKTPIIPAAKFGAMGYRCVIYPVSMLRVAMGAVGRALEQLKRDGSVQGSLAGMQTREELYRAIGYTPGVEWEFRVR